MTKISDFKVNFRCHDRYELENLLERALAKVRQFPMNESLYLELSQNFAEEVYLTVFKATKREEIEL